MRPIRKTVLSLVLAAVLLCSASTAVFAADGGVRVGVSRADITGPITEISTGYNSLGDMMEGLLTRLYARAFVVDDGKTPMALVSAELVHMTESIKPGVLAKLRADGYGMFSEENLMLLATHCHSSTSNTSWYALYDLVNGVPGYDDESYRVIVRGVARAIEQAWDQRVAGSISLVYGDTDIDTCNRSADAFLQNHNAADYGYAVGADGSYSYQTGLAAAQNAAYYTQRAAAIAEELGEASKSIEEAIFSLTNASELLRDFRDRLDFSPEEYDRMETRLALLNRLERKYRCTADELPAVLESCRARLDEIEYADERLEKLRSELDAQVARCRRAAQTLGAKRREAAERLEKRIVSELRALNMPSVRFAVRFDPVVDAPGFDKNGMDRVCFLMSANAGEEPGRISRIASGGELSRIMLAMKNVFAEKDPVPTMIFDEIDTGVSGVAAQRVGEKLYSVSRGKQVLCVTHLPQIAAMADAQLLISKSERGGRTYTEVTPLDRAGRERELARLHGGDHVTEVTLAGAAEQLEAAQAYKDSLER